MAVRQKRQRLTPKQEAFARGVALQGMKQTDAYRAAYGPTNPSAAWVWNESSALARRPHVALRIEELNEKAAGKVGATRETLIERMWKRTDPEQDAAPAISAGRLIATMCGWMPGKGEEPQSTDGQADLIERLMSLDPAQLATIERLVLQGGDQLASILATPVGPVLSDDKS